MAPEPKPRAGGPTLREGWAHIAACFVAIFTAYSTAFMLGPMLDAMGSELGMSVSAMGQLAALTFVPWAISAPLVGPLSDRYGRKPVLLIGLAGLSLSSLIGSLAPDYLTLVGCRLLTGVFGGCVPPSCIASVGDRFVGRTRGNALAVAGSGISASLLAGLPVLAYLTDRLGWRGGFVLAGGFGLCACLFVAWAFPPKGRTAPPLSYLGSFAWMRLAPPWYIVSGNVLERLILSAFLTYVAVLLLRRYAISLSAVAGLLTVMSIGTVIGGLAGGPLAGFRRRFQLIVALLLIQGGLMAFQFSLAPPLALAVAAGFLFSIVSQMNRPVVMDTLVTLAPRSRGAIIGFYATSNQVGQTLGAAVGGLAIAWGGIEAVGWLAAAAGVGGALLYGQILRKDAGSEALRLPGR